ncbi:hypothetical protein ACQY1Z_20250 [Microcystis aeruginosa FBCC-A68]|nr:hypothetical protein [Microcystis aeruginosa]
MASAIWAVAKSNVSGVVNRTLAN